MMDDNLDDSLNLDSEMGVDFEGAGEQVVSQAHISLGTGSHETSMPMEFEPIEEHPMLMDTENEQIIGYSDDQFSLQEYTMQHQEDEAGANTTVITSEPSIPHTDTMIDIQFDPQSFVSRAKKIDDQIAQPKIIAVKATMPPRFTAIRKEQAVGSAPPRQVAIAPKPPRAAPPALKQLTLAPHRTSVVKKVSIAGVVQAAGQGKAVLAQIGKQLVMMPAGSNQKIKLVTTSGGLPSIQYVRATQGDQAQLIATKNSSGVAKPVLAKFIVQGQSSVDPSNQPAVITKLGAPAPTAPRFVTMHQKTVPINMPNKLFVASPTKQTVKITKKQQFVEIKSPTPKLMSTAQTGGTKKVVITATPTQNLIYKTTAPIKNPQINKEGITVQGQRTQLHQINVPGKGIQYIRLVTSGGGATKVKPAPAPAPGGTIVLTDTKGNVIQMATEKVQSGQPPPLVISGTTSSINKLTAKPQQKLVRIAPVGSKPAIAAAQSIARSSQSLLAPLTPMPAPAQSPSPPPPPPPPPPPEPAESKTGLRALIADTQDAQFGAHEVEVEFERQSPEDNSSPASPEARYKQEREQSLIVVPNYLKPQDGLPDDCASGEDEKRYNSLEEQSFNSYQAPPTPQALSETDLVSNELGLRPRKACNCTKSQCLKLYCDCFANGEFCNRCNCNNCHNNLENEELRQKAIRGCLDRNPNAFRPKIGKAKSGGPEIVRRHNKGCNCKRSGCLKNYCECYEAKIACTAMCKCVGCRNVEETLDRRRRDALREHRDHVYRPPALPHINFMTTEVIEAVCQCLLAAAGEPRAEPAPAPDAVRDVIDEFSRCLQDIITAAHQSAPILDESRA